MCLPFGVGNHTGLPLLNWFAVALHQKRYRVNPAPEAVQGRPVKNSGTTWGDSGIRHVVCHIPLRLKKTLTWLFFIC